MRTNLRRSRYLQTRRGTPTAPVPLWRIRVWPRRSPRQAGTAIGATAYQGLAGKGDIMSHALGHTLIVWAVISGAACLGSLAASLLLLRLGWFG